jgi:hypothetical protein
MKDVPGADRFCGVDRLQITRIMRNPLKHCQLSRFRNFREIGDTPQK